MAKPKKAKDIDGYISQFPADVQAILQKVRTTISSAAPEAKETISYQMSAFTRQRRRQDTKNGNRDGVPGPWPRKPSGDCDLRMRPPGLAPMLVVKLL